jgi:hypothetical protein
MFFNCIILLRLVGDTMDIIVDEWDVPEVKANREQIEKLW